MARCDEGYPCDVCGGDVDAIVDSDLYLRFVLGEVDPRALPNAPERHVRCNPATAQYVVDPAFAPVVCDGPFDKRALDPDYVRETESRTTRAWRRLQELPRLGLPLALYPLPADG